MYASFYSHRKDLIINPVRQQRSYSYTESTFLTAAEHSVLSILYLLFLYSVCRLNVDNGENGGGEGGESD